jgi:NAD(P)-dependent dehydrogenase (short-subunit alcohol dehydrogenase family)
VNVKAAFLLSKEVLPYLRKRRGGSIVYISSIAGFDPLGVSNKHDFKLGMYNIRPVKICHLIIGKLKSNHTFVVMYSTNWFCNQKLGILHAVYVFPTIYTINIINWLVLLMQM